MNRKTQPKGASETRPNVLFILTDEWRAQATGYSGDPNAETPRIDSLAAESANFVNAVASAPVCCPSRASLMTGQYPLTHGVYINDVELKPSGQTLGELFKEAGYRTGYIGKWHLYGSPDGHYARRDKPVPATHRMGFDYWKAAECDHAYQHSHYYENDDPEKKYWSGYDAFDQTRDAQEFINNARDEPYFLVVSFGPPHFPLDSAPQEYQDRNADRLVSLRPNVPAELRDAATEALRGYYAHIAALDDCVGALLDCVESSGEASRTIVIFTSDHGDMMGSQGILPEVKVCPWDESVRVPLLVRYPDRFGGTGQKVSTPIGTADLLPTLAVLCGLAVPDGVQGVDVFETPPASAFICMPVPILWQRSYGIGEFRSVRTKRYTYVRSLEGPWLLYDNVEDPYQLRNLCGDDAYAAVQSDLDRELQAWLERLADEFLPGTIYLERDGLTHYFEVRNPVGRSSGPGGTWDSTMPSDAHTVLAPVFRS